MPSATSLSHCLSILSQVVPEEAATLVKDLPKEQLLQALYATGSASVRHRKLPAEQMVWLVIGLSLFRHLPIVQIVDQLGLAVPQGPPVVRSAIHQARARLGPLPLLWLFEATAHKWAHQSAKEHAWCGLGLYGVDGTTMRVPDSESNRNYLGGTQTHRGFAVSLGAALNGLRMLSPGSPSNRTLSGSTTATLAGAWEFLMRPGLAVAERLPSRM